MEAVGMLLSGFAHALTPLNLLMAMSGALIGTLVGVLPGLGPTSTVAILLPLTTVLGPEQGIIMLAGIFYGSQYGGSTTAILLNIPGESSSIATCLDGYPMAQQGKAGPALGISAIGSFTAGIIGVCGLVFFAPLLADQALKFGPPELFALMVLSISMIVNFSGDSLVKGLIMGLSGYLLASVGIAPISARPRFNYGTITLTGGFDIIAVVIGMLAITEILRGLEEKKVAISAGKIGRAYPSIKDLKRSWNAIMRSSFIGFILGLLPGLSPGITTFLCYDLEKKLSKHPEEFGKGAIEGVAAPETANNATGQACFIPMFSLGIPNNAGMAVLLAALMIYGIQPGPMLFQQDGGFVWTVIASMFIGNAMLVILNLPLVGIWAKVTRVPYKILGPVILMLCVVGAYTINNSMFDLFVAVVFGVIGYILVKYRWPLVPLFLCYVLAPMIERSFMQSMAMGRENALIFVQRPISATILGFTVVLFIVSIRLMKRTKKRAKEVTGEDVDLMETE